MILFSEAAIEAVNYDHHGKIGSGTVDPLSFVIEQQKNKTGFASLIRFIRDDRSSQPQWLLWRTEV